MAKNKGWIRIDRKIRNNFLWQEKRPRTKLEAWLDILIRANHQEKEWLYNDQVVKVKRGEVITSMKQLAEDWKWSRQKVKRFLTMIASCDMIVMKVNQTMTRLSVCNYETYQGGVTTHVTTNTQQTDNSHPLLNKDNNYNKDNKEKKTTDSFPKIWLKVYKRFGYQEYQYNGFKQYINQAIKDHGYNEVCTATERFVKDFNSDVKSIIYFFEKGIDKYLGDNKSNLFMDQLDAEDISVSGGGIVDELFN